MKNFLLVAALGMLGFASCKSATCPAYAQKADSAIDQKVMVKTMPAATTSAKANS